MLRVTTDAQIEKRDIARLTRIRADIDALNSSSVPLCEHDRDLIQSLQYDEHALMEQYPRYK